VETLVDNVEEGIPAGSVGTIVHIFQDGVAYEIEFRIPGEEYETVLGTFIAETVKLAEKPYRVRGLNIS
jgi:hypothetical protein